MLLSPEAKNFLLFCLATLLGMILLPPTAAVRVGLGLSVKGFRVKGFMVKA